MIDYYYCPDCEEFCEEGEMSSTVETLPGGKQRRVCRKCEWRENHKHYIGVEYFHASP